MRSRSVLLCAAGAALAAAGLLMPASPAVARFSSFDPQAGELLSRMTLDEKIGQMTQADSNGLADPADVEKYFLGSVLSGGDSDPKSGNGLADWTAMYQGYQAQALKTRLAIPLLYGVDAVHGHSNVLGAVIFPHNIGLGCTRNPALVERAERVTAEEVRASGINWAFAPCVTVPQDERWGRTYEGFGESPDVVKPMAGAAVRGLQSDDLRNPFAVLACAKHFIGDGGTSWGTGNPNLDQGDTRVDEATLRSIHMQGYITAIEAGVGSIMPSYNSWNGQKCTGSHRLLTEILKGELGFEGFLISDWAAIDQLQGDYPSQVAQSINAGMDMVMLPEHYTRFIATLKAVIADGRVPMARVDDAVRRILRVKLALGLMAKQWKPDVDPQAVAAFGSAEHRAVARECVRQSLVLLKNNDKTLPLAKLISRIHVAGKSADDLGNQCGGWTIDWQGKSGNVTTGGTTILAAIRDAVSQDATVSFSRDGAGAAGSDVGVVVVGETPYAEMKGDRADLTLAREDVDAIDRVKGAGIPVVVIVISGRPLILGDVLDKADAVVAAWLPGSEGAGVTDVLFGDYKPTGKLSMAWPRTMAQIPSHPGDAKYDPLFQYGFGLSY